MHSFEVHSNESACRKRVRLALEQVRSLGAIDGVTANKWRLYVSVALQQALASQLKYDQKRGQKPFLT